MSSPTREPDQAAHDLPGAITQNLEDCLDILELLAFVGSAADLDGNNDHYATLIHDHELVLLQNAIYELQTETRAALELVRNAIKNGAR